MVEETIRFKLASSLLLKSAIRNDQLLWALGVRVGEVFLFLSLNLNKICNPKKKNVRKLVPCSRSKVRNTLNNRCKRIRKKT